MNYGRAIEICTYLDLEEFSESEILEAVGTILDMATINAVSKDALLNIVRYFWAHCVEQVENGEAEEYISREAAIAEIMAQPPDAHYPSWYAEQIKKLPAAEVRPVADSYWEKDPDGLCVCHKCRKQPLLDGSEEPVLSDFCPNCGADMRGHGE